MMGCPKNSVFKCQCSFDICLGHFSNHSIDCQKSTSTIRENFISKVNLANRLLSYSNKYSCFITSYMIKITNLLSTILIENYRARMNVLTSAIRKNLLDDDEFSKIDSAIDKSSAISTVNQENIEQFVKILSKMFCLDESSSELIKFDELMQTMRKELFEELQKCLKSFEDSRKALLSKEPAENIISENSKICHACLKNSKTLTKSPYCDFFFCSDF